MKRPVQFRRGTPGDLEALAKLTNDIFRQGLQGANRPREFPLLFSPKNAHNLYLAEVDGRPVSLVGIWPGRVFLNGASVSVAAMGSVCTLEAFREEHLASALIQQALSVLTPQTSLLLVSGGRSLYRRIGCVDFGQFLLANYTSPVSLPQHKIEFSTMPEGEAPDAVDELHALYSEEPLRSLRTQEEMRSLLSGLTVPFYRNYPHMPQVYVARQDGKIVAYAVGVHPRNNESEGAKTIHVIEWAGSRSCILPLMDYIQRSAQAHSVQWYVLPSDLTMRCILHDHGMSTTQESNVGTVRVLNPGLLLTEIQPLLAQRFGTSPELREDTADTSNTSETWSVRWPTREGEVLYVDNIKQLHGYAELTDWIFSSEGIGLPFPRTDNLNYV